MICGLWVVVGELARKNEQVRANYVPLYTRVYHEFYLPGMYVKVLFLPLS